MQGQKPRLETLHRGFFSPRVSREPNGVARLFNNAGYSSCGRHTLRRGPSPSPPMARRAPEIRIVCRLRRRPLRSPHRRGHSSGTGTSGR